MPTHKPSPRDDDDDDDDDDDFFKGVVLLVANRLNPSFHPTATPPTLLLLALKFALVLLLLVVVVVVDAGHTLSSLLYRDEYDVFAQPVFFRKGVSSSVVALLFFSFSPRDKKHARRETLNPF